MKITDALLGEHAVFYALFDELERIADSDAPLAAKQVLVRVIGHVLLSHAKVEDELLFPALGELPPVRVMRADHEELERLFDQLGSDTPPASFSAAVGHAVDLTRDHFNKEEMVLLPYADAHLEVSALERLGEQWSQLRGVTLS
jgi:hemerythrin superfamily protein